MPIYGKAGDIFFTHGFGWLQRLILWAQRDPGEEPSEVNHMGVVVEDGWVVPPYGEELTAAKSITVEALSKVIEDKWWDVHGEEYLDKGYRIFVFRHIPPPTQEQVRDFTFRARSFVGNSYGWWRLAVHLLDRIVFKGKKKLSGFFYSDKRPECSYVGGMAAWAAGWYLGSPPQSLDPDEAMDYVVAHPEEWERVLE